MENLLIGLSSPLAKDCSHRLLIFHSSSLCISGSFPISCVHDARAESVRYTMKLNGMLFGHNFMTLVAPVLTKKFNTLQDVSESSAGIFEKILAFLIKGKDPFVSTSFPLSSLCLQCGYDF